jgi:hypothetical protein
MTLAEEPVTFVPPIVATIGGPVMVSVVKVLLLAVHAPVDLERTKILPEQFLQSFDSFCYHLGFLFGQNRSIAFL